MGTSVCWSIHMFEYSANDFPTVQEVSVSHQNVLVFFDVTITSDVQ